MIEFQLGKSTVGGGVPYHIHHVDQDVQVSSSISTDDAVEIRKPVCVRKFFNINLDWSWVTSIQSHNFGLLVAGVEANLFHKGVKVFCHMHMCNHKTRGEDRGMQICRSMSFFRQIH